MKRIAMILAMLVAVVVFADDISDTSVAEAQVTVPAHIKRPSAKYNPAYQVQIGDTLEVVMKLNGNIAKTYRYVHSIPPTDTSKCVRFVARLEIVENNK